MMEDQTHAVTTIDVSVLNSTVGNNMVSCYFHSEQQLRLNNPLHCRGSHGLWLASFLLTRLA